jgi:hypothetical protein
VLALAYPLQQYVSQSSQLDKIRSQNAAKEAEVAQLKQQLTAWQDSAFVEIQARKRLHYVKPGEIGLRLLGPTDASGGSPNATSPGTPGTAWYSQLWNSVTSAASASATPSSGSSSSFGSSTTSGTSRSPSGH